MADTRTIITDGTLITAQGTLQADVVVEGERVSALLAPGSTDHTAALASGARRIDTAGMYVLPGGIDVHTHMEMPFGGTEASDTFETGSRAAAWGGTTTIIDFAVQKKGSSLQEALDTWHGKADGNSAIDYAFHMIMSDVNEITLKEMDVMLAEGVSSFKLFTAYPGVLYSTDAEIFRAMQKAGRNGGMIMMHCENGIVIDEIIKDHLAAGETAPYYHSLSRPEAMEAEATHRCIQIAKVAGSPMYVVHLSAREALAEVTKARDEGFNVFAETCPQYLYRSIDDLARPGMDGFEGANFVCSTPLRHKEHQAELWRGIRRNDLSVVSTDHCPFCFKEQKEMGRGDFSKIPNGMAGVEHRMDLLFQGTVNHQITLARWVEVAATTPARLFGLYPQKGTIAPGSDADIVIYDPGATQTLGVEMHHMNVDYSAYEGERIDGKVRLVMSRGKTVIEGGAYVGAKGDGRYTRRGLSDYLV